MKISEMSFGQLMDAFEAAKMEGDAELMLTLWNELSNRRGARAA